MGASSPAAPNEDTDKYADHPDDNIGEAEKPRRNLVHACRGGYPDAEDDRRENGPPTTRNDADDQTGSERGDEDHELVVGAVAVLPWLFAGCSRSGDIPARSRSRAGR
jgi:hypothetical protein